MGGFGEMSQAVRSIASLIASELAADQLQFFDLDLKMVKSFILQQFRRTLDLMSHRGLAKLLLDRTRDLVQHPNQPRPTHVTDEDDAEAYAYFHHIRPPGKGRG